MTSRTRCSAKLFAIAQLTLSILLTLFLTLPTSAILSANVLDFYNKNGIYYYDPSGTDHCVIGTGSYDGSTSAGLSETQAAFVDTYHDIAQQLSVEYGIPWETVVAQGILESAAGTSNFAVNRNNFFGIGAFDSNPNNAFSYATPEEGWRGYYENIRKTSTYRNHGVFQEPNITDPYAYTAAIKAAGYASDPNYVSKVHSLIAAIEIRSQEKGWLSSAELAVKYPEMLANAAIYAAGPGEAPTSDISYGGGACISQGNGDLNSTALELAWPDRTHSLDDPTASYALALEAVGLTTYGDINVQRGSSCDAFVATVYRYSGVDPNFFCCGVGNPSRGIYKYLIEHPDLYDYIGRATDSSLARPGDIRIRQNHHIEMVVQKEDGTIAIASASYGERTGDVSHWYNDANYEIFRHK